jgi:hypothetical protein
MSTTTHFVPRDKIAKLQTGTVCHRCFPDGANSTTTQTHPRVVLEKSNGTFQCGICGLNLGKHAVLLIPPIVERILDTLTQQYAFQITSFNESSNPKAVSSSLYLPSGGYIVLQNRALAESTYNIDWYFETAGGPPLYKQIPPLNQNQLSLIPPFVRDSVQTLTDTTRYETLPEPHALSTIQFDSDQNGICLRLRTHEMPHDRDKYHPYFETHDGYTMIVRVQLNCKKPIEIPTNVEVAVPANTRQPWLPQGTMTV